MIIKCPCCKTKTPIEEFEDGKIIVCPKCGKKMRERVHTGFLKKVADFFERMSCGIIVFLFKTIPVKICNWIRRLFELLFNSMRLIFWFLIWVLLVSAGFMIFQWNEFVRFCISVWHWIVYFTKSIGPFFVRCVYPFLQEYGGWLWMVVAVVGSVYGLLVLKKRNGGHVSFFKRIIGMLKKNSDSQ